MLLNSARKTVMAYDEEKLSAPSLCPLCESPLVARRGEMVCWHWAHHPKHHDKTKCPWHESEWHLQWKQAYLGFDGWEIEYPIEAAGNRFIADATSLKTGRVREFVHSLSNHYASKHMSLKMAGRDVLWIWDGDEFVSERHRCVSRGGISRLLKPRAWMYFEHIGGLVHFDSRLWRHWKDNVFYPCETDTTKELLRRFYEAEGTKKTAPGPAS